MNDKHEPLSDEHAKIARRSISADTDALIAEIKRLRAELEKTEARAIKWEKLHDGRTSRLNEVLAENAALRAVALTILADLLRGKFSHSWYAEDHPHHVPKWLLRKFDECDERIKDYVSSKRAEIDALRGEGGSPFADTTRRHRRGGGGSDDEMV